VTPALIAAGDPVLVTATIDDTRYLDPDGVEPSQAIAAGQVWLDTVPWTTLIFVDGFETGDTSVGPSVPITSMGPTDGTFDTTWKEHRQSRHDRLEVGRHLLYVRGRDAANNWGAVSASS